MARFRRCSRLARYVGSYEGMQQLFPGSLTRLRSRELRCLRFVRVSSFRLKPLCLQFQKHLFLDDIFCVLGPPTLNELHALFPGGFWNTLLRFINSAARFTAFGIGPCHSVRFRVATLSGLPKRQVCADLGLIRCASRQSTNRLQVRRLYGASPSAYAPRIATAAPGCEPHSECSALLDAEFALGDSRSGEI